LVATSTYAPVPLAGAAGYGARDADATPRARPLATTAAAIAAATTNL
jgi:hypothetical protein